MALFAFGLFGLAAGFFFPLLSTYFQKTIPKEYHGRFFSFRTMLDRVMFQVVLLATGFMLDTIGLSYMVLVFGGLSALFIIYAYVRSSRMPERPLEAMPDPGSPSM